MNDLFKYHGIDLIAMLLSLIAIYLIGNQNRWGFLSFMVGNALWVFFGLYYVNSYPVALGNFIFLLINLRGYLKWKSQNTLPDNLKR